MKKFFLIAILTLPFAFLSCEQDDIERVDRASFESEAISFEVPRDAVGFEKSISVFTSNVSGSDRVFQISTIEEESGLDSAEYSLPSSVTIPANSNSAEILMTVSDVSLSFSPTILTLELLSDDATYTGYTVLSITERCDDTIVGLNLVFDTYAEEAYWDLYDLSNGNTIIFSGGQDGAYSDFSDSEFNVQFCLASGNYGIVVYDSYGDGGTAYTVSAGDTVLTTGTVPGGNAANDPTASSAQFTVN